MPTNPTFALIIGVSTYRDFDPSGGADLPGAIHDTGRWEKLCAGSFGVPSTQVRVLRDAASTTRSQILEQVGWLAKALAEHEGSSGLLTFSGHGLTLEDAEGAPGIAEGLSLALAPSDITPDLKAAITFAHLERELLDVVARVRFHRPFPQLDQTQADEARGVLENLTVALDACYDRPQGLGGRARALTAAPSARPHMPRQVFPRLLLACQLWETAYEVEISGQPHGAFTYAITTMLSQWSTQTDSGTTVRYSRGSYGDVAYRTRSLVNTLGLEEQNPTLLGEQNNLALIPFLRPGTNIAKGWTTATPDGFRQGEEISAETGSQIRMTVNFGGNDQGSFTLAYAQIENPSGTQTESWYFDQIILNNFAQNYSSSGSWGAAAGGYLSVEWAAADIGTTPDILLQNGLSGPVNWNTEGTLISDQTESPQWISADGATIPQPPGQTNPDGGELFTTRFWYGATDGSTEVTNWGVIVAYHNTGTVTEPNYTITGISIAIEDTSVPTSSTLLSLGSSDEVMSCEWDTFPAGWYFTNVYGSLIQAPQS